jgi:hypothetical protein
MVMSIYEGSNDYRHGEPGEGPGEWMPPQLTRHGSLAELTALEGESAGAIQVSVTVTIGDMIRGRIPHDPI